MRSSGVVFLVLAVISVLMNACDLGTPADPHHVLPGDDFDVTTVEDPQALLLQWQAQGAIPEADVNRDGLVNIVDLVLVAQNFGQAVERAGEVEIIDLSIRPTEKNDIWWRYAWKLTLRNGTAAPVEVDAEVKFLDADGFIIDVGTGYDLALVPGDQRTFTGFAFVTVPWAENVVGHDVELRVAGLDVTGDAPQLGDIEVVELIGRATEKNDIWWRYAWQLALRSNAERALDVDVTIKFLDADGFVIDEDWAYGLVLDPGEEKTFSGFELVSMPGAEQVTNYEAAVGR